MRSLVVVVRWILPTLIAGAGVTALIFGGLAATAEADDPAIPTWRAVALWCGVGVIVFTLLQGVLSHLVERRRQSARVETLVVVNGALEPIVARLARIAAMSQSERKGHLEAIREGCVASALGLVRTDDVRVSYFPASGSIGSRSMREPTSRSRNRTDQPTSHFEEGSGRDEEVWTLVDSGEGVLYPDLRKKKQRPASWGPERRPVYRSFISVGVMVDSIGFGLLSINTKMPRQLKAEDLASMQVLASLLASAEALCAGPDELDRRHASQRPPGPGTTIQGGGENE